MSASPTVFINGEFIEVIEDPDWKAYLTDKYPGVEYELKNGYQVIIGEG